MRVLLSFAAFICFVPTIVLAGEIEVTQAYAYATSSVQKNGAIFMQVKNASNHDDKIVGAHVDIADRTELHTHNMDGDMMMMREVEHYDVPAQGSVSLEPMGHHIMLFGLDHRLNAGDHFPLTLSFEIHDPMIVDVQVKSLGQE